MEKKEAHVLVCPGEHRKDSLRDYTSNARRAENDYTRMRDRKALEKHWIGLNPWGLSGETRELFRAWGRCSALESLCCLEMFLRAGHSEKLDGWKISRETAFGTGVIEEPYARWGKTWIRKKNELLLLSSLPFLAFQWRTAYEGMEETVATQGGVHALGNWQPAWRVFLPSVH